MNTPADARLYAPSAQRNRAPILAVLERVLPPTGTVLEVASGTGEHAVWLAPRVAPRIWQPSDPDPAHRASIAAWAAVEPAPNLRLPLALDAVAAPWPVEDPAADAPAPDASAITAIVNINMIHIAPWAACLGVLAGAGRILAAGGVLYFYGPFKIDGRHTAPSNANFDASLQARDPDWGVRDLGAVAAAADEAGLTLAETVPMPANNLSVIFHRAAG